MIAYTRLFRAMLLGLCAISMMTLAANMVRAQGQPLALAGGGHDDESRFVLRGVAVMAGKSFVSIQDKASGRSRWLEVGDYYQGHVVKEITEQSVTLSAKGSGNETILRMAGFENSTDPAAVERYSTKWQNSGDNPMYYNPCSIPLDIARDWANLPAADKSSVIELYRKYGWNLIVAETVSGSTNFAWENMNEKERKMATEKAKTDFTNSLNPDQKVIFSRIRANPSVMTGGRPRTEEEQRKENILQKDWVDLRASLSPTQKEIYEAIGDSMKAVNREK